MLCLFMAVESDTLIWNLKLENESEKAIEYDVFAYTEFSQLAFENEVKLGYYLKWNVKNTFNREIDAVTYLYSSFMQVDVKKAPVVYFSSSEKCDSFCCDRDSFCGNYRDESNPVGVEEGKLNNKEIVGGEPCGALHHHITLNAGDNKTINYYLGITPGALFDYNRAMETTKETLAYLKSEGAVKEQFDKTVRWWNNHLGIYQCNIPDEDAGRQINIWNPVQSVVTARFSRSISSSASGIRGIGFRDTAQDMLAQAYRKPDKAADMLFYLCSQQHEDGHAVHACWPEDNKLPQELTRSDDHIWPVYLAYAIAAETGDIEFLNKEVPFLGEDLKTPCGNATVWEHLLRGIEFTENHLGKHGLPLILFSDWNDHVGPFGRKGKGESVFVSEQHIYALKQLTELAELRNEPHLADSFREMIKNQESALEKYCWDGQWYIRGIDDDGNPFGSHNNDYAQIWVNTQSWMIISGTGDQSKNIIAMDSVREKLDTGMGLKINTPGLPADKANNLPAGYSENGGIFCQANCWAIMAEALLGRGNRAWQYYKTLIPHEIIKRIGVQAFRGEPYAYSSTMLGPDNENFGQACVSQVTGTAAWMDVISTQYILGIRPTINGLVIDPSIPGEWKEFSVQRKFRGCNFTIDVTNPEGVQHGIKSVYVEGNLIENNIITQDIIGKNKSLKVKAVMG